MMSFILLDEHLRACSQDSSNKIKPLFIIKQTRGQSSVRTSFRVFGDFRILSEYERDIDKYNELHSAVIEIEKQIVGLIRTLRT